VPGGGEHVGGPLLNEMPDLVLLWLTVRLNGNIAGKTTGGRAMSYAVQAEGLEKRFGETRALDGVSLAARTGTVLGVLGPNGAGKTTAVRVLATLTRPDAGTARVGGYDVVREAHQVRQLIGLTGQYAGVDEMLTGSENLLMIGRLLGLPKRDAKARAAELLAGFGLTDAAERAAKTYSGGMRRRLDLAASLVGRPQILYLDEPTTGLDPRSRNGLWDIVRGLVTDGVTVLLTTQYLEEADQLAHDIVVIDHGKVIAEGTPDELKKQAGGQVLEIRPIDAADEAAIAKVLAELMDSAPSVTEGLVSVPVTDAAVMPLVVRRLDDAGVAVGELALRRPSLDEVFFSLTGHRAETEETEEAATAEGVTV
jgi:oleandomycin transport system ATP-binding protein